MNTGDMPRHPAHNGATRATVAALAAFKQLDEDWLRKRFRLSNEANGVRIPYTTFDGKPARARLRENTETSHPTKWNGGGEMTAYADPATLAAAGSGKELTIVEGESNVWTLEAQNIPALGVPGASMTSLISAQHVDEIETIRIVRDPDAAGKGFVAAVIDRLREIGFGGEFRVVDLQAACGAKDPSDLHICNAQAFQAEWKRADEAAECFPSVIDWPPIYPAPQLDAAALYGLAGKIIRCLDPLVEATPIGMLLELLCAFGNAGGPASYALVGDDKHPARLFVCLVGPTSTGGKGNADAAIRPFIRGMDCDWFAAARASGFGSGEGIIARLCGAHTTDAEPIEKRLLIYEPEFSRMLALNKRDGATLSMRLRQLWDDGLVQDILRGKSVLVEDAHVSVIGHVTPRELCARLPETDISGGYANRFLFPYVRSDKRIPSPEELDPAIVGAFAKELSASLAFARVGRVMRRSPAADALWDKLYKLHASDDMVGEVIARSDAQRLRLSVAYALLDQSATIEPRHVLAAEAVVRYCVNSAAYIFAEHDDAEDVSRLIQAAREVHPGGLTGAECHAVFANNLDSERLEALKRTLVARGLASIKAGPPTGGRRSSLFYANERIKRTNSQGSLLDSFSSYIS